MTLTVFYPFFQATNIGNNKANAQTTSRILKLAATAAPGHPTPTASRALPPHLQLSPQAAQLLPSLPLPLTTLRWPLQLTCAVTSANTQSTPRSLTGPEGNARTAWPGQHPSGVGTPRVTTSATPVAFTSK